MNEALLAVLLQQGLEGVPVLALLAPLLLLFLFQPLPILLVQLPAADSIIPLSAIAPSSCSPSFNSPLSGHVDMTGC